MLLKQFQMLFFLLFATVCVQNVNAQANNDSDSAILSTTRYFHYTPYDLKIQDVKHINYEVDYCSQADPVLSFNRKYYTYTGDAGHAHTNLFFTPRYNTSFIYQPSVLDAYLFTPENVRFHQVLNPYTEIQYNSAFLEEYFFNATHTQNVFPNWNIAFENHFINTEGYYVNSAVMNNYLNFTTHYFSKDSRYRVRAGAIYNYTRMHENAGIINDSLFTENIQTNRSAIPVNTPNAYTKWKEVNAFANQMFSLYKPDTVFTKASPLNFGAIGHTIQYQTQSRIYFDTLSDLNYYQTSIDTNKTYDSIGNWNLKNTLFWTNDVFQSHEYKNPVKLTLGINHQYIHLNDISQKTDFVILSPLAKVNLLFGNFTMGFSGEYSISSTYHNKDYVLLGNASFETKKHKFLLKANLKEQDPLYFFTTYSSNHFSWKNKTFEKENIFNTAFEYSWNKKITIGAAYYQYRNAVFLDDSIKPYQHRNVESLLQFYTAEELNWKIFKLDNFAAFQVSSNDNVFRLPAFELKQTYSVNFYTFKRNLFLQTGFDIRYNTSYFGDSYSPALASFYRQNDIKTGNNLWLDVFISGRIKRAFIYLRFAHVNALFNNKPTYYMVPHYPTQDFEFKFGLIWKFFG